MKYLFCLLILMHFDADCQKTITGQVLDLKNNSIGLASIDLVGKNVSATTDDLGVFYLKLPSEIKKGDIIVVRVSKEGYKTATRQIAVSSLSIPIRLAKSKALKIPPPSTSKLNDQKATELPKDTPSKPAVSVTSYFQSGGITADQVNIGPLPRVLNANNENQLLSYLLNKDEKIDVTSVMGDSEAFQFANEIADFLKKNGYNKVDGVNQGVYTKPIFGQVLSRDSTGVKIVVGSRK